MGSRSRMLDNARSNAGASLFSSSAVIDEVNRISTGGLTGRGSNRRSLEEDTKITWCREESPRPPQLSPRLIDKSLQRDRFPGPRSEISGAASFEFTEGSESSLGQLLLLCRANL